MVQKSPVNGIYISSAILLFISCVFIGLSDANIFIFFEIVAAAILLAGRRYLLLTLSLVAGIFAAAGLGGSVSVAILLAFLATGAACGLFAKPGNGLAKGMAAGAILFTLTAVVALLVYCYKISGSISPEQITKTLSAVSDNFSEFFLQSFKTANTSEQMMAQIKDNLELYKTFLTLEYVGIVGLIGVIVSFFATLAAQSVASKDKGIPLNALDFKLSRVGGIAMLLVTVAASSLTGMPWVISSNLSILLSAAFFIAGCVFIINLFKSGKLFKIPFLFYAILMCLLFIGVTATIVYAGIYRALDINWSKLKPPSPDGDDF